MSVEQEVHEALLKSWASWDVVSKTLTLSRPPELTHTQLETIWSSHINQSVTDAVIDAINREIDREVRVIRARGEQERQEQVRRQEEETQRRRQEADRALQERLRAEQEAKDKAEALLLRSLTDNQKQDLALRNYFLVESGGETYKINRGFAGNVKLLDQTGREIRSFCIHPTERVPDADNMLAQKLMLETDKERFLRIANATDLVPRPAANRAA